MYEEILIIFFVITVVYLLILLFSLQRKICAICASVFLTWILFLILYYLGYFKNVIILALLIGGTVSGLFNLLKQKINIFKLPFILTSFAAGYFLLVKNIDFYILTFIAFLWLIFGLFFLNSKNQGFKSLFRKILECCKNW